jgi:hypothetical protein
MPFVSVVRSVRRARAESSSRDDRRGVGRRRRRRRSQPPSNEGAPGSVRPVAGRTTGHLGQSDHDPRQHRQHTAEQALTRLASCVMTANVDLLNREQAGCDHGGATSFPDRHLARHRHDSGQPRRPPIRRRHDWGHSVDVRGRAADEDEFDGRHDPVRASVLTMDTTASTALSPRNSPLTQSSTCGGSIGRADAVSTFGASGPATPRTQADFTSTDCEQATSTGRVG